MNKVLLIFLFCGLSLLAEQAAEHYKFSVRASGINPEATEYSKINYTFTDTKGKVMDLQHAAVDVRVPSRGQLVIWLMGHNQRLFDRINSYGLHAIQPHYANRWFSTVPKELHDAGNCLGDIRLEAATGRDYSPHVQISKPDGLEARSLQFVKWLVKKNPDGKWDQFLNKDHSDLLWDKVILSGSSHGSTTSARFAKHRKVARVVMFCGPRDQLESWQGIPSVTPANRYFGFTHILDTGWVGDHYCRSWQMLGLAKFGPLVNVDQAKAPFGNSRRLVTNCDVNNDSRKAHSIVVRGKDWDSVWRYLFTHPVDQIGGSVPIDPGCKMNLRPKIEEKK